MAKSGLIPVEPITSVSYWKELGYSSFIANALAAYNEDCLEDPKPFDEPYSADDICLKSPEEVMEIALTWNGIIGYSNEIVEAVRCLLRREVRP